MAAAENFTYLPDYRLVDGYRLPKCFLPEAVRSAYQYEPKEDDFFIASFPKSGSTWTQMIVYLIYKGGKPPTNINDFYNMMPIIDMAGAEAVDSMIRPGCIKTHLAIHKAPFSVKAKYIHLVRNPKDLCASFFYHTRSPAYNYHNGTFDQYFELFINGQTDFEDWFDHVLGWYQHRNNTNVLHLKYEQLKRENKETVYKIARFMGKKYMDQFEKDPNLINEVLNNSNIDSMKRIFNNDSDDMVEFCKNKPTDLEDLNISSGMKYFWKYMAKHDTLEPAERFHIIRNGIIGDWKNLFSEEQADRMDKKIEEKLKGTELYDYWKEIGCI